MKKDSLAPVSTISRTGLLKPPANPTLQSDERGLSDREAIALAYLKRSGKPKVVARGAGVVAEEIIRKAKEHGIFVYESRELLVALSDFSLDQEIPPELYHAIAAGINWLSTTQQSPGLETQGYPPEHDDPNLLHLL